MAPMQPLKANKSNLETRPAGALEQDEPVEPQLDPQVFAIKLWRVPPAPVVATAQASPPVKPPNLRLVGIISESGRHMAAIYDVDADRLVIVASGDHIGQYNVTAITSSEVELSDGQVTQKLALLQEPA